MTITHSFLTSLPRHSELESRGWFSRVFTSNNQTKPLCCPFSHAERHINLVPTMEAWGWRVFIRKSKLCRNGSLLVCYIYTKKHDVLKWCVVRCVCVRECVCACVCECVFVFVCVVDIYLRHHFRHHHWLWSAFVIWLITCEIWLIHMRDMTHLYGTWLIHMWDMTHSGVTWLIPMWHDSFTDCGLFSTYLSICLPVCVCVCVCVCVWADLQ